VIGCGESGDDAGRAKADASSETGVASTATVVPASSPTHETEEATTTTPPATKTPSSLVEAAPSATAADTIVWPTLMELVPAEAAPNQVVEITGWGGHVRTADGGYIESLRGFDLTLDGQLIGELSCYINLCSEHFTVPAGLAPGSYTLATEGGSQLTLTVPDGTLVWPTLAELQPAEAVPGQDITIRGTGGYLRGADGSYNESARSFRLTLDGEPLGRITCYANLCAGSFQVWPTLTAGTYAIATEGGSQLTLTVQAP
jgi:hypothetical protein